MQTRTPTGDIADDLIIDQRETELSLCAAAMYAPERTIKTCSWLPPEAFVDKTLGKFWKEFLVTSDPEKVAMNLDIFKDIGMRMSNVDTLYREDLYATRIATDIYLRKALGNVSDIARAIAERDIDAVQKKISDMANNVLVGENDALTAFEVDEMFREVLRSPSISLKTYIGGLDNSIGGLFGKELIVIAARTSMGKTALTLQIARNVANDNKVVLFVSLEMSAVELWARMACTYKGYEWKDVRSGMLNDVAISEIEDASLELQGKYEGYLYIADNAYTLPEMYNLTLKYKPNLLIVDQLPDIRWHDPSELEVRWYGEACRYLRNVVGRTMDIPVILIHQLHRGLENRQNKRPILSDLRWSGDVEQSSDVVLMMYREDYYKGKPPGITVVPTEIWVRKNRQGVQNACVHLDYDLKAQWFT